MITRVEVETPAAQVVTSADYEADRARGYCILEWAPAGQSILRDARSRKEITRQTPAVHYFRCMDCQFDTMDPEWMAKHRALGQHPWAYTPFESPYGNIADVVIEGIEDYSLLREGA